MNPIAWYENYDGPKTLGWQAGEFVCGVGFNVTLPGGGARGEEVEARGRTMEEAIEGVRTQYERLR